jgi:NADH dehydrogenase [ubiquinone] 1 alpha subcomplex assembly factor 7
MTPLGQIIREMIMSDGPMGLDRYMTLALGHPHHGYYITRDPLGRAGDFTTAPEISQVFGELLGIWAVAQWQAMGEPASFLLVELGPGRGTLMADLLRAAQVRPRFGAAARLHLIETSPVLRAAQAERLGPGATWHFNLESLPAGPALIIANEFFDALPIRQFEARGGRWFERLVGLAGEGFRLGLSPRPVRLGVPAEEGAVMETAPEREAVAEALGHRLAGQGGAALVIDYGHGQTAPGDTLQAMRAHGFAAVLAHPGEADITAHVDFEQLGHAFRRGGAMVPALMTQGDFLAAMGLAQRVEKLAGQLAGADRENFLIGAKRLAEAGQMGSLFKVMTAHAPGEPAPYPFGAP